MNLIKFFIRKLANKDFLIALGIIGLMGYTAPDNILYISLFFYWAFNISIFFFLKDPKKPLPLSQLFYFIFIGSWSFLFLLFFNKK